MTVMEALQGWLYVNVSVLVAGVLVGATVRNLSRRRYRERWVAADEYVLEELSRDEPDYPERRPAA